jgi:ABC-type multidrug transport system ATPase subunit
VSLQIRQGELLGIIGRSGCGKSTLLRALAAGGRQPFTSGTVLLAGADLYAERSRLARSIALVPQHDLLHDGLTVAQTLEHAAGLRGIDAQGGELRAHLRETLARVRLDDGGDDLLERRVEELSGGQRRRLQLACEIVAAPALLLADEITSGLDPALDGEIMDLLADLAASGMAVVCVTHSHRNLDRCDRVAVLDAGRLVTVGTPTEALAAYAGSAPETTAASPPAPSELASEPRPRPRPSPFRETGILLRRLRQRRRADRVGRRLDLAQVVTVAAAIALVFGGTREDDEITRAHAAFVLCISGFWLGFVQSIFELVGERPLFVRERALGVRVSSYLVSKLLVLVPVTVVATLALQFWTHATVSPLGEWSAGLALVLAAVTAVGVLTGLAASAALRHSRWAIAILFAVMMTQLVFSGSFELREDTTAAWLAGVVSAQRWAWQAALDTLGLGRLPVVDHPMPTALAALAAQGIAALFGCVLLARRPEP